ncbi:uncharacterized protein F4822DRAFT_446098 [Hypoxylon trugodes]|uniref:uncharacterized protein n=1 Tax=Hypoxylon trugodes TaxID=326681 RepID=UPI00219C9F73|nr:uncharacterized protein F4822DRAFT_446098 [Hypoxylon trugodes]KAI1384983.1 hypothetical protein F4822DRAFT_446098 [Hypoxylon trugodes]
MSTVPFEVIEVEAHSTIARELEKHYYNTVKDIIEGPGSGPYTPRGRYVRVREDPDGPDILANDWYNRNGIPHQVSLPGQQGWWPLKLWMMGLARGWTDWVKDKTNDRDNFGTYELRYFNFFNAMKKRIAVQKIQAFWTRFAHKRQVNALTRGPYSEILGPLKSRVELIMVTLIGLNRDPSDVDHGNTLREFIASLVVTEPFREYRLSYLEQNPQTKNPCWNLIQPVLGNIDIHGSLRATYGTGDEVEMIDVDKSSWSHEDHACRFIRSVYQRALIALESEGLQSGDFEGGFMSYFFMGDGENTVDIGNKYWFGFSLLCLLIKSWQFNELYPSNDFERVLVPALYPLYQPHRYNFPAAEVGQIDLSPETHWVSAGKDTPIDFEDLARLGLADVLEEDDLDEPESDTILPENGYPDSDLGESVSGNGEQRDYRTRYRDRYGNLLYLEQVSPTPSELEGE